MSGRSNFTPFWPNCLFLPDMILHFFPHNLHLSVGFLATFLMQFAFSGMNLLLKSHFQHLFVTVGHVCAQFFRAFMGVWYVKLPCFYSK